MVLVDELGRGTSTTDGLAIAVALAEALLASNALVWFATHFHDLARILSERSGVINLHLAADITPYANKMTMRYQIAEGPVPDRRYGLELAKLVDLPPAVLEVARTVSWSMDRLTQRRNSPSRAVAIARKRKLLLTLREELILARNGTMDNVSLRQHLLKLQDEFALRMAAIDEEVNLDSNSDPEILDEQQERHQNGSQVDCTAPTSRTDRASEGNSTRNPLPSDPSLLDSDSEPDCAGHDSVVLV
jgi:DNA mismatch repair protein MSH4